MSGLHLYQPIVGSKHGCPECVKARQKLWWANNKAKRVIYTKRQENQLKAYREKYYRDNKEKLQIYRTKYEKENPGKLLQSKRKWSAANKDCVAANVAARRSQKLKAQPLWLTKQQKLEIKTIYKLAKDLAWLSEDRLEVDHIIPLRSKIVCGLHVPWNLQILPKRLNAKKSNKVGA